MDAIIKAILPPITSKPELPMVINPVRETTCMLGQVVATEDWGMTSGKQHNPYISGSFIMSACWRESFLCPDDRFPNRTLDLVDLNARATFPFQIPRKMWLPIVASPNPGLLL